MLEEPCDDGQASGRPVQGDTAQYDRAEGRSREQVDVLYTSGSIDDVFRCISMICTRNTVNTPLVSDPALRVDPPLIRIKGGAFNGRAGGAEGFSFHLPPDFGLLYSAAPLAYYLGAPVLADDEAFVAFDSACPVRLEERGEEEWMGEMLRRTFYLDCAVRHAWLSKGELDGLDVEEFLGTEACDVFRMTAGERFLLYARAEDVPGLPAWHMASYLDPVAKSVEALPYLLRSLSAIYSPRSTPTTERGLVSMAVRDFLGRRMHLYIAGGGGACPVVVPSLREAGSQLWFSSGYPIDAAKASVRAFENRRKYGRNNQVRVGVICNEPAMEREVDVIVNALADAPASIQVYWDAGKAQFAGVFARGFDVVQLIGHCGPRGFKCNDGYALVEDIGENNTPMFFFNSCSSHLEAAGLIEKGSVCGVATFFRVLEEAAVDVCRNFYRVLGAGYSASMALDASRQCSVLGKEYLLLGDGSFRAFRGDELRPFYRIDRYGKECTLGCTIDNTSKGNLIGSWSADGEVVVSDLGFKTRFISVGHLAAVAGKFKGFCLYDRSIYASVKDAARQALNDSRHGESTLKRRWRMVYPAASLFFLFLSSILK
jgi:hypothetical protein